MSRPLLLLAAAVVLGSAVGEDVGPWGAAILLALSALALGAALVAPTPRQGGRALLAAAVGIGAAGSGTETAAHERQPLSAWLEARPPSSEPFRLEGVAFGDARDTEDRFTVVLDVDRAEGPGQVLAPPGRVRVDVGGTAP